MMPPKRSTFFMSLPKSIPWRQAFTALKYRNYRLWFWGQMVSLFGTWMQMTAQAYLMFELTRSPAYLGYLSFAQGIPAWLFMIYAGVIADRISRRYLLLITQTCMMILAFILAGLAFTGIVQPWQIVVLAFGLGIANAFDAPARQAIVFELVEREDLTNAIALNSTMFNTAIAVGPAASGIVYALVGPAWCFTINAVTFLAVIWALVLMRLQPLAVRTHRTSTFSDLIEGFRYVAAHPVIRILIGLLGIFSLFGISFITLLPAWAVNVLGGNETTNGLLQSARGIGALIGALGIAMLGRFNFKGKLLTVGSFVFPAGLLVFTAIRTLPLAFLVLTGVGMAFVLFMNLMNALVQGAVADQLRGRVMAIYSFSLFGFMPIGGLLVGAIAEYLKSPLTLMLSALVCLSGAAIVRFFFPFIYKLE